MPQFILPTDGEIKAVKTPNKIVLDMRWQDLDEFTQGYIQALFFTNTGCGDSAEWATPEYQHRMEEGQTDGDLPNDVGFSDIDPKSLAAVIVECEEFQEKNAALLEQAYAMERTHTNGMAYSPESAGMDFWYNRVGHGVGFWDRGLGEVGEALSEACGRTEINPYFHDGKVYID